jgi:hypothetical protein
LFSSVIQSIQDCGGAFVAAQVGISSIWVRRSDMNRPTGPGRAVAPRVRRVLLLQLLHQEEIGKIRQSERPVIR